MKLKNIMIKYTIIMSDNTYSEKSVDISTPPPPPRHPRLIRAGGGVIPDIIAPAMSGSILIDPRTSSGLPQTITYCQV